MTNGCGMSAARLTPHDERRVAVAAGCDPRTVRAYLDSKPQRSTIAARVRDTLHAMGFDITTIDDSPTTTSADVPVDGGA